MNNRESLLKLKDMDEVIAVTKARHSQTNKPYVAFYENGTLVAEWNSYEDGTVVYSESEHAIMARGAAMYWAAGCNSLVIEVDHPDAYNGPHGTLQYDNGAMHLGDTMCKDVTATMFTLSERWT